VRISAFGRRSARLSAIAVVVTLLAGLLTTSGAGAIVAKVKPLRIGPATLRTATATVPYSHALIAAGGTGPYTFTLQEGAPPAGINLSPSGELTGTAAEAGSSTFTVLATDSSNPALTATKTYTLEVQLDVQPKSIKPTPVQGFINVSVNTVGGSGSYEYSLVAGKLPEGLNFYPSFHELFGNPAHAGDYAFTIQSTDTSSGATGTRAYKLHVSLAINPAYQYLPRGFVGHSYAESFEAEGGRSGPYFFEAEGGSGAYTYELSGGELPAGMSLTPEPNRVSFSGAPEGPGTSAFWITAKDTETGITGRTKYFLRVLANYFPHGKFVLEEKDHEGAFLGQDTVTLSTGGENHGVLSGTLYDAEGRRGWWTYDTAKHHVHLEWPVGASELQYDGTCEPVAQTCSGEDPSGTFTLSP
jgi:hypothetical protein